MNNKFRKVSKIFSPPVVPEGKGAQVVRIIGTQFLKTLDPFLMLDYAVTKLPAGFPDHPHRGFETVSYMLEGKFYHEDSKGHKGVIGPGDVQWMTAGKGIIHSEIPGSYTEFSRGFQLWVNLTKEFKYCDPQYQEFKKEQIPTVKGEGVEIKLVAGEALNVSLISHHHIQQQKGPVYTRSPAFFMDIKLDPNTTYTQRIPQKWNCLCFVYNGEAYFGQKQELAKLEQVVVADVNDANEELQITTKNSPCSFILIAGLPLNEPIYQHGPFVLNSKEEIQKTFEDYQEGKNGFEGSNSWRSSIRKMQDGPQYLPKQEL